MDFPDLLPDPSDLTRASGSWLATLGVGIAVGPIAGKKKSVGVTLEVRF